MSLRSARARGFTIIEMVVVMAILGILAAAAFPLAELSVRRVQERELKAALKEIRSAIDAYKRASDEGRIPRREEESGYPPSLQALVAGVEDSKNRGRKIYFLRRIPRDPFALPGETALASWGLRSYDSPPEKPTPGRDVFDVYSKSDKLGINGIAYREW